MDRDAKLRIAAVLMALLGFFYLRSSWLTGDSSMTGIMNTVIGPYLIVGSVQLCRQRRSAGLMIYGAAFACVLTFALAGAFVALLGSLEGPSGLVGFLARGLAVVYLLPAVCLFLLGRWRGLREALGILLVEEALRAIQSDDRERLDQLLDQGLPLDERIGTFFKFLTPLCWCVLRKAPGCAKLLLDRGADREAVCGHGLAWAVTPARLARRRKQDDMAELISA